ncbi:protein of unknown function [Cyanobium sp. NIES-981]|nr:protein of unknown function [Cyanobium sp. NIES-981]
MMITRKLLCYRQAKIVLVTGALSQV